jgi:prepilin-type cleavage/methylation N-terminal domain protein
LKNKGFSLIELVVVVSITLVSIHGISQIYSNILIKKEVEKETIKIISLLRRSQIESREKLIFNFNEKKILAGNEVIELNKNYEYMFNSNNDKKYLEIEFNENHNASKAFSIFISKKNKVLKRISFDTINAAKYPIIRVYDV